MVLDDVFGRFVSLVRLNLFGMFDGRKCDSYFIQKWCHGV